MSFYKLQIMRLGEKKGKVGGGRKRKSPICSNKRTKPAKRVGGGRGLCIRPPCNLKSSAK